MVALPPGVRRAFRLARGRPPVEVDVDAEVAFHLEMRAAELVARGLTPEAAHAEARRRFGDVQQWSMAMSEIDREQGADRRRADWLADLGQDVRYGARSLRRAPLFALLAVLTLALGIGANAAVFGVLKSVLLDALPYADADRLVRVHANKRDGTFDGMTMSAGAVTDVAERVRAFERVGVFMPMKLEMAYQADDGPRPLSGALAGTGFFQTLGVPAQLGRLLGDDDMTGEASSVVLSHGAWQRLFAGDPAVVGRVVQLNGGAATVVGILPRAFVSPIGDVDVWVPLDLTPHLNDPVRVRRRAWLSPIARLRPGVTADAARRELAALSADLGRQFPDADGLFDYVTVPLRDDMAGSARTPLLVLMGSAGLVLLIACSNLAGALLSRTISRRKEFAVRVALGAGRGRLVRQLLTESTLLALAGGAAGLLLAALGLSVLRGLALPALPPYAALTLDAGAVAVTSLLALVTGVAFGLAPALSVGRADPQGTLREEARGASEGRRAGRLRGLLVAGQIALCVSLLSGAGLLARSLQAMMSLPLGFDAGGVLTASIQPPGERYPTMDSRVRLFDRLEERLRALPGVRGVAFTSAQPGSVLSQEGFAIDGAPWPSGEERKFVLYASVTDGYFSTLGIPLRAGRAFAPGDRAGAPAVVVISETMARRFWPDGNAVGARIRMGPDPKAAPIEVIGVVGDVRNGPGQSEAAPMVYGSGRQDAWGSRILLVRSGGDPLALARAAQRELAAIDPGLPLHEPTTLEATVAGRLSSRRLPVVLMLAFGALALVLASVGVYAMFANMAAAREREFGVRVALGSSRRAIAALVFRQGAAWMAVGLAAGALGVVAVSRLLGGLLYGVRPFDPVALGLSLALLLACAAAALLVPVRRATRVDPITVLR